MDQIFRILLVEDELHDAELNKREIRKVLPSAIFELVDNKPDYLDRIERFKPDLIISDYNLPSFDGLSALHIAQHSCPLIPFIMVTGSINEDTAVECMKSGATDYVLKDSLKRLGASVVNALNQFKIKKERTEAIEMLKLSEARYRYMFHNHPQPMMIYDADSLAFIEVNEAAVKHYGFSNSEFLNMNMHDIMVQELGTKYKLSTEKQSSEFIHRKKNDEIITVEVISHPITYNHLNAVHALINDITQRKKAEEKLIQERKLLRILIDNIPVTIYIKDADCRKIIANKADLENIGVKTEIEVIGKTDIEIYPEETGIQGYKDDLKVIETGLPLINQEELITNKNNIQRCLLTSKIPFTDEEGKIIGLIGIGLDITDLKISHEKILKLSKAIEQSPVSIEITDTNGIIEYVNPQFCKITGYTPEEVIGQHVRILRSDIMNPNIYSDLWETIRSGNVWHKELLNKRKDGTLFWESVTLTSIKNEKDIITNYIAIKENITERKQMEAELIQAKDKAEESDRLKSAFLANMSHEIRTPLNSIIGFSELLGDPDFDQNQKEEFIHAIIDNSNSLLLIISDIMDFSMLEAHQLKIRKETFNANKLIADLQMDFCNKACKKGIDFHTYVSPEQNGVLVVSDLYRIKQIFNNLINNSLKFTDQGVIEIGFTLSNDFIVFHVKDTGIGIDPIYHQSIFERFRQVDLAMTRKYGGNGLGLSISKNLAELLGGKIWVESEPGKYSNFYFSIPIK